MEVSTNNFLYLDEIFTNTKHIKIKALFSDSRIRVENGMFFCVKGLVNDGHKYVSDAINNGAVAIVYSDDLDSFNPDVQYIMISQVASKDMIAKAYESGVEYYISKPIDAIEVQTVIKKVIENNLNKNKRDKIPE